MHCTTDLRILFPTSFSDSCFRTARAIAQLADTCRINLTIAHVVKTGTGDARTRRELDSFMAEADHYDSCQRVLAESDDAIQSIAAMCESGRFDLIVAPASDRLGLHSLFTTSFRARLMKRCKTPLWTMGACLDSANFKTGIRTIACVVDFGFDSPKYLPLVTAFAERLGARLRIVTVLPEISEGTLARSLNPAAPLTPEMAVKQIHGTFDRRTCPEVSVAVGETGSELPRLLRECDAQLAFLGRGQALRYAWLPRLARHLDRMPCPVICVDGAAEAFHEWSFQTSPVLNPDPWPSLYITDTTNNANTFWEDSIANSRSADLVR